MSQPETKTEALSMLGRARAKLASIQKAGEKTIGTAVATAEIGGTAFLLSFMRGRNGEIDKETGYLELTVGGIPVSLVVGLGGHVAGFAGVGGKFGDHLHNIASGALAEYAAVQGLRLGQKNANETAKKEGKTSPYADNATAAARIMGGPRMMGAPGVGYNPYLAGMHNQSYAR
jgi:hypothetical protein